MASIEGQDPAHVRAEEEDPSVDYPVEPDETAPDEKAWDEEDGLIDAEEVLIEADPVDVAEQRRSVED
ncbi:hypothetical protein [Sinomonas sp. P10A9]|uniref:Uncharacterized protein n=1 Tax=Sinomonas puerhi TaxID=3238584 RepID=A0AB39L550_9MICC